jgi:hypothetical protein
MDCSVRCSLVARPLLVAWPWDKGSPRCVGVGWARKCAAAGRAEGATDQSHLLFLFLHSRLQHTTASPLPRDKFFRDGGTGNTTSLLQAKGNQAGVVGTGYGESVPPIGQSSPALEQCDCSSTSSTT